MKNLAVSRRYAKALIMIGQEDGRADQYRDELSQVVGLLDAHSGLESTLVNPLYNRNDRKAVLQKVLSLTGLSDIMNSFLVLLFDKGRIAFLRDVTAIYSEMADEIKGVMKAGVTSAVELSEKAIEKIRESLSQKTGREIVLEVRRDPELIGGVVTKIGDLVLDGSVRTQLINMKETLKKGENI